jgi:hypothetical protein
MDELWVAFILAHCSRVCRAAEAFSLDVCRRLALHTIVRKDNKNFVLLRKNPE